MKLRIASPVKQEVDEDAIQKAFESNLAAIEEGLVYIGSSVPIGTGIIDTPAIDDEENAVIIEYKKPGDFDEDALIQLMNYYSWFASDQNHRLYLHEVIAKTRPQVREVNDVRLIEVVSEIGDEVKNACWALKPSILLVNYSLSVDPSGETVVYPNIVIDTSVGGESMVKPPKTEEDHLRDHQNLRSLYFKLKDRVLKDIDPNITFNPSPQSYVGVTSRRLFLQIGFKDKWLSVLAKIKPHDVGDNPRLIPYGENSEWSYARIEPEQQVDEELMMLLKIACDRARKP